MYSQVEKVKENKSKSVANSVGQSKSNEIRGLGFVNNRPEAVAQRKLQVQGSKHPHYMGIVEKPTGAIALAPENEQTDAPIQGVFNVSADPEAQKKVEFVEVITNLLAVEPQLAELYDSTDVTVYFRLIPGDGGGATSLAAVGELKLSTLDDLEPVAAAKKVLEALDNAPISISIEVTSYEGERLNELEETLLHEVYLHLVPLARTMADLKDPKRPMFGVSEFLGARLRDLHLDHRNLDRWMELIMGTFKYAIGKKNKTDGFRLLWSLANDLNNHFGVLTLESQRSLARAVQLCINKFAENQYSWDFKDPEHGEDKADVGNLPPELAKYFQYGGTL